MAFNVAGLNPFTIIAVAIRRSCWCTGISTGSSIILTGINAITAVWGAAVGWFSGVFELVGQVKAGLLRSRLF